MILYRPVGLRELHLIAGSDFRAFPPRLRGQDFFYPVLDRAYAEQIARDWNTEDEASSYAGFVTRFELPDDVASRYPVHTVGGGNHRELWVPAADLFELNRRIVGSIEVVDAFAGPLFEGSIDPVTHLPRALPAGDQLHVVYRLAENPEQIANTQRATLTTQEYGIEPTHGLLGSDEWWQNIAAGTLPVRTLRGHVTRVYMGSMNDWPEFEMRSQEGEVSRWTREVNRSELDALYAPGRRVEVDYVVQHFRPKSISGGSETKIVLEIRVGRAVPSGNKR